MRKFLKMFLFVVIVSVSLQAQAQSYGTILTTSRDANYAPMFVPSQVMPSRSQGDVYARHSLSKRSVPSYMHSLVEQFTTMESWAYSWTKNVARGGKQRARTGVAISPSGTVKFKSQFKNDHPFDGDTFYARTVLKDANNNVILTAASSCVGVNATLFGSTNIRTVQYSRKITPSQAQAVASVDFYFGVGNHCDKVNDGEFWEAARAAGAVLFSTQSN